MHTSRLFFAQKFQTQVTSINRRASLSRQPICSAGINSTKPINRVRRSDRENEIYEAESSSLFVFFRRVAMSQADDEIDIDADVCCHQRRHLHGADFGADALSDAEREPHEHRLRLCG